MTDQSIKMLRTTFLLGVLTTACSGSPPSTESDAGGSQEIAEGCADCNVLLISIDTLRADHLSLYGYHRPTTPNLERLAEEAVVFDQMVNTGGGTLPVHMSMMTSLPTLAHNVWERNVRALESERITLAEQLSESGFKTAAFTDGGYVGATYGFDQGFDLYDDLGGGLRYTLPKTMNWIEVNRDSQFFLFLHTFDTHSKTHGQPYGCDGYNDYYTGDYSGAFDGCIDGKCASELLVWINRQIDEGASALDYLTEEDLDFQKARYDGCINYVDDQLNKILDQLRELDIFDKTLIIITSDHGEEFLDHGFLLHENPYWENHMHIPLVIKFPDSSFGGQRISHLATSIDLMPTILEVLGIPLNDQAKGVSLLPAAANGEPVRQAVNIFAGMRTEHWKYIPGGGPQGAGHLFYITEDKGETENLVLVKRKIAIDLETAGRGAKLRDEQLYEEFAKTVGPAEDEFELGEEEIEKLKALGYIQ